MLSFRNKHALRARIMGYRRREIEARPRVRWRIGALQATEAAAGFRKIGERVPAPHPESPTGGCPSPWAYGLPAVGNDFRNWELSDATWESEHFPRKVLTFSAAGLSGRFPAPEPTVWPGRLKDRASEVAAGFRGGCLDLQGCQEPPMCLEGTDLERTVHFFQPGERVAPIGFSAGGPASRSLAALMCK